MKQINIQNNIQLSGIRILKIHSEYSHVYYIQELKKAESQHRVEEVISNGNKVNRNKSCKPFDKMAKGLYSITSLAYHGGITAHLSSTFKESIQVTCHQDSRTNTNQLSYNKQLYIGIP